MKKEHHMANRKLRPIIAGISILAMLTTVGCGSSTSTAGAQSSAGSTTSPAVPASGQSGSAQLTAVTSGQSGASQTASSAAADNSPVTLKIINWVNPPANDALKKINSQFEAKYPNIKVDYQIAANTTGSYATLLQTTVTSHSADIITTNFPFQPLPDKPTRDNMTPEQLWATSGLLLPLNDQPWVKSYTKEAIGSETYNRNVYGLLTGVYQWMVFYDKTVFKKYNLSVPQTYTDFIKVMDTLKANGVTPLWLGTGGGADGYVQQFLTEPLMASLWLPKVSNGNLAKALESGSERWDSPNFVDVMTKEAKVGSYLEPGYTGIAWQGMPGAFAAGKSAMLLDGSWDLASVNQANPKMDVGSFPLPGSDDASKNQSLLSSDLTFEVLKDAPNKDAALKYLAFFSEPNIYQEYVNTTGISPSQTSGTYSSFASKVLGDTFGKGISTDVVFPILSAKQGYYCQSANFPEVQVNVIAGKKSPPDAAKLYQGSCTTS
jgi:raffinose/stachyose/melibiose transport system substrate-binding protein